MVNSGLTEWVHICVCLYTCVTLCVCVLLNLDYIRSVSLPVQLQTEATGSSSSEPGSVSPDCDSKQDVFFEKKKRSSSENLIKPPSSNFLRWAQKIPRQSTKVNVELIRVRKPVQTSLGHALVSNSCSCLSVYMYEIMWALD